MSLLSPFLLADHGTYSEIYSFYNITPTGQYEYMVNDNPNTIVQFTPVRFNHLLKIGKLKRIDKNGASQHYRKLLSKREVQRG